MMQPTLASGRPGGCVASVPAHRRPPVPLQEPTIGDTVENSVCSKQPVLAECLSMGCQSIDQMWPCESCAGPWSPLQWRTWCVSLCTPAVVPRGHPLRMSRRGRVGGGKTHRPETRGPFGVTDTATPEVKFLDRCLINCSEGVLQACVRRSRTRVWGAKMIRHRRSPTL